MSILVKISGTDRTGLVPPEGGVSWSQRFSARGDATITLNSDSFRPVVGNPVEIWEDGSLAWGGLIAQVRERALFDSGTVDVVLDVSCTSWEAIADERIVVVEVYTSLPAGDIVADLRTKYLDSDGITAGTIDAGATVGRLNIDHQSFADVIDDLAKLSGFTWYIDAAKALHFRTPDVTTAPFTVVDATSHVTELSIERSLVAGDGYANEIIRQVAPEAFAAIVEDFTMTGSPTFWDLSQYAGSVESVQVDTGSGFEERTFGLDGVESARDYYWQVGSSAILQDGSNTETGTLRVTYRQFGASVVTSVDAGEIAARAAVEGTSGRHTIVVDDSDNVDATLAQAQNDAQLDLAKVIPDVIRATTVDTKPRAGQVVTFAMTTPAVAGDFIVQEVTAQNNEAGVFRYSYTATNVSRLGGWQEWLKRITSGGASGSSGSAGAATTGGSSGSATIPPGDFTIGALSYQWITVNSQVLAEISIPVTPPGPIGSTQGGHIYVEVEDQSGGPVFRVGTSVVGGGDLVGGNWIPTDEGKLSYVAVEQPWKIQLVLNQRKTTVVRVYVEPYSSLVDAAPIRAGEPGETPSATVTVSPYAALKPSSATNITPVLVTSITATALDPVNLDGKLKRPIAISAVLPAGHFPSNWAFQIIGFQAGDITTSPLLGTGTFAPDAVLDPLPAGADGLSDPHTVLLDEPKEITSITIYAVAGLIFTAGFNRVTGAVQDAGFAPNNIVPGLTASATVSIGTTTGVLDPTDVIQDYLNTTMAVLNGLFGIAPLGVSNTYVDALAIATGNIQDAAIALAKLASLSVDASKLINAAVTTSKIDNLAVTAAQLASSSVTATKIDNLAVGTAAIAVAAVTTAKIANLAVTTALLDNAAVTTAKIGNAQITTALIANLAVSTALIANLAVTDAKINDLSVSKLTTGSMLVASASAGNGITVQLNGGNMKVNLYAGGAEFYNSANFRYCLLSLVGNGGVFGVVDSGGTSVQLTCFGGAANLVINGSQVVTARQTDPGAASGWADSTAQGWANSLRTALRNHGLI